MKKQIIDFKTKLTSGYEEFSPLSKIGYISTSSSYIGLGILDLNGKEPTYGFGSVKDLNIGIKSESTEGRINFNTQVNWNFGNNEIKPIGNLIRCKKSFPGVKEGDIFDLRNMVDDGLCHLVDPEYFDFEVVNMPNFNLTLHSYELNINESSKTVNWGCREFTFEQIKDTYKTILMLQNKDLQFGLGYDGLFSSVDPNEFGHLVDYLNSLKD